VDLNSGSEPDVRLKDSVRRESGDLSTLVSQPSPPPSWKQEVNKCLEAHKSRKGLSVVAQSAPAKAQNTADSRAAQAAARVAARYAKAPSYSEMQAIEARAALRAAEAATRVALEAQAVAQVFLANLETLTEEPVTQQEDNSRQRNAEDSIFYESVTEGVTAPANAAARQSLEIRWEPDMPVRPSGPAATSQPHQAEDFDPEERDWRNATARRGGSAGAEAIEPVEPAQPIHANLIHFPRELVATRRMRPRLTGNRLDALGELFGQLSIFEVDPSTISTEPSGPSAAAELPEHTWSGPEWSGIQLDEQPEQAVAEDEAAAAPVLYLAPLGYRLLAAAVDGSFIVGVVCGAVAIMADYIQHPPTMKAAELGAIGALIVAAALYHAMFLMFARATPGMRYARIALCNFEDENPTPEQVKGRLVAMMLSLLPVGLGVAWSIFDEDHLSWHDRLSRTYLRKY